MILVPESNLQKAAIKHYEYFRAKHLADFKVECQTTTLRGRELKFLKILLRLHKTIIIGNTAQLAKLNHIIELFKERNPIICMRLKQKKSKLYKTINKVFDYNKFVQSYFPLWGAYALCKELELDVCPYCNRQYISVLYTKKNDAKTRPDLDHFFDKETHPYFALSLYNLVPCCKICNSSFKHSKKFDLDNYLHPFTEGFGNDLTFSVSFTKAFEHRDKWNLNLYYGSSPEFELTLKERPGANKGLLKRAKNNAKVFKIVEIYNFHKDIIFEIIQKSIVYNEEMIKDIYNRHSKLFSSEDEVWKMIMGNYLNESELSKRPLAKCVKDVSKELGLLK